MVFSLEILSQGFKFLRSAGSRGCRSQLRKAGRTLAGNILFPGQRVKLRDKLATLEEPEGTTPAHIGTTRRGWMGGWKGQNKARDGRRAGCSLQSAAGRPETIGMGPPGEREAM